MRLQPCAEVVRAHYYGFDIRKEVNTENRLFLDRQKYITNCRFIGVDVETLAKKLVLRKNGQRFTCRPTKPALVFLPFNFLGNLARPRQLVESLLSLGYDLAVSQFATTAEAQKVRELYYVTCGLNVHFITTECGDVFQDGNSFSSTSFNTEWMNNLIDNIFYKDVVFEYLTSCELFSIVLLRQIKSNTGLKNESYR